MLYDSDSSDFEYEDQISNTDDSGEYKFPHNDSLIQSKVAVIEARKRRSDSIEIPNAPELERKTSPQRPKGLANISLGFSVDPDRQAMRDELTRLKSAAGLLPNQGTSPSYSESEESTAFWEEEHTKRLLRIQAKGKNLKVRFPDSPDLVTGRASPPAWYYKATSAAPETPPSLITPDLPESDSEDEPIPSAPDTPASDSDEDTPDMYCNTSSDSSIEEYDMTNMSFTKLPDSHDVHKPRMNQLTKGVKNRSREDLESKARTMMATIAEEEESDDSELAQMREMMNSMNQQQENNDMRALMRQMSGEDVIQMAEAPRQENSWGSAAASGGFSSAQIIRDSSDEESTDDSENQRYVAEQLRQKAEREKRESEVHRSLDKAELGGGPIVYYDDSDEESSSDDQEYVRQQMAILAKKKAKEEEEEKKAKKQAQLHVQEYSSSEEDHQCFSIWSCFSYFDLGAVKKAWLSAKGGIEERKPSTLMIISTNTEDIDERVVLVDYKKVPSESTLSSPPITPNPRKLSDEGFKKDPTYDLEVSQTNLPLRYRSDSKSRNNLVLTSARYAHPELGSDTRLQLEEEKFQRLQSLNSKLQRENLILTLENRLLKHVNVSIREENATIKKENLSIKIENAEARRQWHLEKSSAKKISEQEFMEVIALVEPWLPGWPALHKQFPSLFQKTCMTCCDIGWFGVVATLVEEITRFVTDLPLSNSYFITRIESQFGGLRLHISKTTPEIRDAMRFAREESMTICEMCGQDGVVRSNKKGTSKCLCEPCEDVWIDVEDTNVEDEDDSWD